MASAPATVHLMPDDFRRWPITALQPASTTPEPVNRPREVGPLHVVAHPAAGGSRQIVSTPA